MTELRTKEVHLHQRAAVTIPGTVTDTKNNYWSSTSTSETSHSSYMSNRCHSSSQLKSKYNSSTRYNMSEEPLRRDKALDLKRPTEDDVTISHMQPKESWPDEECDIELSLSIGCSSGMRKAKNWLHPRSTSETKQLLQSKTGGRAEKSEECSERESLQSPPWLFQAMTLNKT